MKHIQEPGMADLVDELFGYADDLESREAEIVVDCIRQVIRSRVESYRNEVKERGLHIYFNSDNERLSIWVGLPEIDSITWDVPLEELVQNEIDNLRGREPDRPTLIRIASQLEQLAARVRDAA